MLKMHSSDSELEFTQENTKNPGKHKKKGGSGGADKKNRKANAKSKNQIAANEEAGDGGSNPVVVDKAENVEINKSTRKQMGSEFENNAEEVDVSSSSEESDGSSSSSDMYGFGRRAIGIDPEELKNYDGKADPLNGSQYLMKVMQETRRTPKIAVGSVGQKEKKGLELSVKYAEKFKGDSLLDANSETKQLMSTFSPSQDWRDTNIQEFSLLRCKIERWRELLSKRVTRLRADTIKLPEIGNKVVWLKFCFGIKFEELMDSRKCGPSTLSVHKIVEDYFVDLRGQDQTRRGSIINESTCTNEQPLSPRNITTIDATSSPTPSDPTTSECSNEGCQPLMSLMLVLSQQHIESLLYFQSDWINRFGFTNKCQGEWLYALLACIDKPVDPSAMGDIRNICKALITIRNKYCTTAHQSGILFGDDDIDKLSDDFKKELSLEEKNEDISSQASEYLNALNLFIFLIGDYFCQKDLVEGL